ncbi:hypothetical protein A1359_01420 [Methylomonas lenta]|uniref:Uncharacterized protein n=1 Tax=Methylomonas lenta TaxID=980561 RepID=A0A177N547_9GAMM|nr:hypothetical protein [Methylomonas lenta]OAI12951.1 hypothetical protein A1359_01420 [Methylomonas lenta]
MNTRSISKTSLNILQLLLQINFNVSVIFVLVVSLMSLAGSDIFFENNSDLYGPLANNLRMVLLYLCFVQLAVYGFYQMHSNYAAVFTLGAFLLILIVSLQFYSIINQIEIDPSYQQIFLYVGLSHVLYGGICVLRKNNG